MDSENRTFETEYRGNYVRHKFSPVVKYGKVQDFKDPIAESFKDYLSTAKENDENIENYQNYMERLGTSNPKLMERYFQEPLKTDLVEKLIANAKETTYHDHYCKFERLEKYMPKKTEKRLPLPEGWKEAATTQRSSYRDPVILLPNIYKKRPDLVIAPCEMDDAYKHSIKPKKVTELQGTIGELGKFILDNEMHGKIEKVHF